MKTPRFPGRIITIIALTLLIAGSSVSQNEFWVSGYLTSWSLNTGVHESGYGDGNLHKDSIDYDALTHVIMFAISLGSDGSIGFGNLSPGRRGPYNDFVHSKGKPVILSVGGAGNNSFASAISPPNRTTTVRNLLDLRRSQRYDGYDIDMEPVNSSDTSNLRIFIKELYDSLQKESAYFDITRKPMLTAATYNNASFWARLAPYLDQINLMTYDFFGTWFGKSWHNNAPYGGPDDVDIYNVAMTTVESKMQRFLDAGIPRSKFGVGVDFNGYVWKGGLRNDGSGSGITAPRQTWSTPPTMTTGKEVTGYTIKKNWIDRYPSNVHYDAISKVPYIGIDSAGSANDYFITYQDTSTAREIVQLGQNNNLGGIIIWELGGGYYEKEDFPGLAERHPMLQAIKRAVGSSAPVEPPATPSLGAPANASSGIAPTVTLQWNTATGAIGFDLQVSTSSGFGTLFVSRTGLSQTSSTVSGLAPSTTYYWRVRATNSGGASGWTTPWSFITAAVQIDTTSPSVTISSPLPAAVLTGTVNITATASDNGGIAGVQFIIGGSPIGPELTAAPYQITWNTGLVANGDYDLTAFARDLAGNSATSATVTVSVANTQDSTLEVSAYTDTLLSPWRNASWSSVISFSNNERVFEGTQAIKSVANAWGALRLRSGSWSNPVDVNTRLFEKVEFAVYNTTPGIDINVYLQNDADSSFPVVSYTNLTLNQWVLLSIPMSQLNPRNHTVHALAIQNNTTASATVYVDEIRFLAPAKGTSLPDPPALSSPPNGQTGLPATPTLTWTPVAGALTYDLQVSTDAGFNNPVFQANGLSSATVVLPPLQAGVLHYWRVRGVNAAGAGVYSSAFYFRTLGVNRVLLYSRTSVDFGRVGIGYSKTDSVRLDNGGVDPISLSATTSSHPAITASIQSPTIGAGEVRYLRITFNPASRGTLSASTIIMHDGANSPDTIAITGRGVNPPRIRASSSSIDFGSVSPGALRTETLMVSNEGELDLEFSEIISTNSTFRATAASMLVGPGASTSIQITARPQASQIEQGYLLIYNNSQAEPESIHIIVDGSTTIGGGSGTTPETYQLRQNYPNPFNPTTSIEFDLPMTSNVRLMVFNSLGQEVMVVANQVMAEGIHRVLWSGRDSKGHTQGSGVYFYRLAAVSVEGTARPFVETRKMILAK